MPFDVVEAITVCLDYGQKYVLPPVLVNTEHGIGRQDHVVQIPMGIHHAVPLEVVNFEAARRQDIERQRAELQKAGRRPAIAEEFDALVKVMLETPRSFSISADGTSFNYPYGVGSRFVLSLINDDWPWRVFAAWPDLRAQPGWCMLVAPLELPAVAKAA